MTPLCHYTASLYPPTYIPHYILTPKQMAYLNPWEKGLRMVDKDYKTHEVMRKKREIQIFQTRTALEKRYPELKMYEYRVLLRSRQIVLKDDGKPYVYKYDANFVLGKTEKLPATGGDRDTPSYLTPRRDGGDGVFPHKQLKDLKK